VNRVKQTGGPVEDYYTQLQGFWKELDVRRSNPMTNPVDVEKYNNLVQEDRVLTFLDGLDDRLDHIRATVLQIKPFLIIEQAFSLVRREENRQTLMLNKGDGVENSMVMLATDPILAMNKSNFKPKIGSVEGCTYCHNPRHTRDKCFKLIGYPEGWKDKRKKKQWDPNPYRGEARVVSGEPTAAPVGPNSGCTTDRFGTADRTQAVAASVSVSRYSLVPPAENKESSEGKSFLITKKYHTNGCDWIRDSKATDHMTYSEKDLVNSYKSRRTKIVNANGEVYPVTGAGDVQFCSSLTLSNTLLVPSLSTRYCLLGKFVKN
jgi:hypothetical protein